jgi:hypothetical protein
MESEQRMRDPSQESFVRRLVYRDGLNLVMLTDKEDVQPPSGKAFEKNHFVSPARWSRAQLAKGLLGNVEDGWAEMAYRPWAHGTDSRGKRYNAMGNFRSGITQFNHAGVSLRKWSATFPYPIDYSYAFESGVTRYGPNDRQPAYKGPPMTTAQMIANSQCRCSVELKRLTVPLWPVLVLCSIAPGILMVGLIRRMRRVAFGRCPNCGYDMRATPDRCPECGRSSK